MGQLSIGVISAIIIASLFIICFCIGVLVWILQRGRDNLKSKVMVTMTGTTIRNRNGDVSVLEATWIPDHTGPMTGSVTQSYHSNVESKRLSSSSSQLSEGALSADNTTDLERGPSSRNSVKRSSYMSAKRLEIPEALREEDSEYDHDNLSSDKDGSESPGGVDSGAVTPAEIQAPKIYIQDVDAEPIPIPSPGFEGKGFDIDNLLKNVNGLPKDEKADVRAV
ncbi:hypothetical protein TWF481_002460 [Arthrobotrys musiformis]|uniref:Uncharacterized protein n=1 Tax=Arthrobotrys musiformis TaxID=47236 RepID=A0AAV9VUH2_9PEZI